eukprot:2501191-Alexandrium_andersonii.AAC.1
MAEVVPAATLETTAAGSTPPPMAEAFPDVPTAAKLPFTAFPGLTDAANPVMAACHAAWNELVDMVGPEFVNQVTGEGAERLTAGPAKIPDGPWVAAPEGRRISEVVCVFRSMKTAETE